MGKAKRVRFLDDETDDFLNSGRNNSSNQEAAAEPRIIDGPKTSEYAFFKKMKKAAGCSYSRSKPEVDKESKRVEFYNHHPGQPVGGASLSDKLKSRNPDAKFSSPAGNERNAKHCSFISPLNVGATKSAIKRQTDTLDKIKRSNFSLLHGSVTTVDHSDFFSPTSRASANKGNQYFGKGEFAEKRRKLHQRAVDTLFPELGEGCPKGFHIVSKLLNRLFPKGSENDDIELVKPTMDATDNLSTLSTSYSSQKKVHMDHKNTSMDLKNDSSFDDDMLPTYFHGITKKDLASEREDSLAIYDTGANFLEYEADPQLIRRYQNRNSKSWFPYEKMRTKSFYIQELDEHTDQSNARKREPRNFLLDWDFGREKEKDELHLPSHDVEDCTYSSLSISRIDHKQQFIGDRLDEIALPSLSFPRISPEYDLVPYWQPDCFDSQNAKRLLEYSHQDYLEPRESPSRLSFNPKYLTLAEDSGVHNVLGCFSQPNWFDTQNARRLLEYGHQEDLDPRESPPRLSSTPKYLTLAEDSGVHNVLECDNPTLCFQDNPCCITNVLSDRPHHAVEALLLSRGLDIDRAWQWLSSSSTPGGRQSASYYSSRFPQRELSTSYLPGEGEFDPGLHTSHSRKTNVLFSKDALTLQDCSFTNILELDCHSLIDSSCWDEPYIPKEDDYK